MQASLDLTYLPQTNIQVGCNRIEHWVHLRCAGNRLAQYTDTWTCHLHTKSRLTTHTAITPSQPPRSWPKPHPHRLHNTPASQADVQHSPCSHRIGKSQTQSCHIPTPHLPPARAKHIHISHTPLTPRTTLISSTSYALDTNLNHVHHPYTHILHSPQPHLLRPRTSIAITLALAHSLSILPPTQIKARASQSPQPPHPLHRVPRQPHRQTKYNHMTTHTPYKHKDTAVKVRYISLCCRST